MTRGEALECVNAALDRLHASGIAGRNPDFIAILEALGLIKFEEPAQAVELAIHNPRTKVTVFVDFRDVAEALRVSGYDVSKTGQVSGASALSAFTKPNIVGIINSDYGQQHR